MTIGLGVDISQSSRKDSADDSKVIDGSYSATDREQITRATIGNGTIIVGGKEKNPEGLNRDESKAQEITKDINVGTIDVSYNSDSRDWNEVKTIVTEHGSSLGKDLDNLTGGQYNLEKELAESFNKVYGELEKIVDENLLNKYLGVIPTEELDGGILGLGRVIIDGGEKLYVSTYEAIKGENGEKLYDENGQILFKTETKLLTKGEYEELQASLNGVGNTLNGAIEGTVNGLFSESDKEVLEKGGTIQKISVHNPTHGLAADLIEAAVGEIGLLTGTNLTAKDLTNIVKERPSLLSGMIAHSQGALKLTLVVKELMKTEEGQEILKNNVGKIVFAGPAVNDGSLNELRDLVGSDKVVTLVNEKDILNYMTLNKVNTKGEENHPLENYNYNFEQRDDGLYERPDSIKVDTGKIDENGTVIKTKIKGKIEEVNGKSTKSILNR